MINNQTTNQGIQALRWGRTSVNPIQRNALPPASVVPDRGYYRLDENNRWLPFGPTAIPSNTGSTETKRQKTLEVAQEAMASARKLFPAKSGNKKYQMGTQDGIEEDDIEESDMGDDDSEEDDNYSHLSDSLRTLRPQLDNIVNQWEGTELRPLLEELYNIIDATKYAAGNCTEYSQMAAYRIFDSIDNGKMDKNTVIDIVKLDGNREDHMFVAINQPRGADGTYPKDFSHWTEDACIVDAWANITCFAREYPQKWEEKMKKWHDQGKLVDGQSALNKIDQLTKCVKLSKYNTP